MRNATKLAMEFNSYLPVEEAPEYTEGYEGFYHLLSLNGDVEQSKAYYIIREILIVKILKRVNITLKIL